MSTEPKRVVVKWQGRYLATISPAGVPAFTWAPVAAKRFDNAEAAHTFCLKAEKFPGDTEVVPDPLGSKW